MYEKLPDHQKRILLQKLCPKAKEQHLKYVLDPASKPEPKRTKKGDKVLKDMTFADIMQMGTNTSTKKVAEFKPEFPDAVKLEPKKDG